MKSCYSFVNKPWPLTVQVQRQEANSGLSGTCGFETGIPHPYAQGCINNILIVEHRIASDTIISTDLSKTATRTALQTARRQSRETA